MGSCAGEGGWEALRSEGAGPLGGEMASGASSGHAPAYGHDHLVHLGRSAHAGPPIVHARLAGRRACAQLLHVQVCRGDAQLLGPAPKALYNRPAQQQGLREGALARIVHLVRCNCKCMGVSGA